MTTPLINFAAGSGLTAAQLNEIQPLQVIKPADQSVTSSTTLVNDTALSLPLAVALATYLFKCYLDYEGGTLGSSDLKFEWVVPSGATMRYGKVYVDTSGTQWCGQGGAAGGTNAVGTNGAGNLHSVLMTGSLVVSSTTGTLQLEWAQNTSNATATIVHAGSIVSLQRVS